MRDKSEVAHKWAGWLHHPSHVGGSPTLESAGQNRRWPASAPDSCITAAAWGLLNKSKRGTKLEVANKKPGWLNNPGRLGGSQRFTAHDKITSCPLVGGVAT